MRFFAHAFAAAVLGLAVLTLPVAPVQAQGPAESRAFVEGFDDLPLMSLLTQEPGSVIVFDSPYGRIVEAWASGRTSPASVLSFYGATLPQLGWRRGADSAEWRREGEVLTLDVQHQGEAVTVRFQVSPTG